MDLTGKQKRFLRASAHAMKPIFQIGKGGATDELVHQIGEALEKRELIKVSLLPNTLAEPEEVTEKLEKLLNAAVVQHIGNILVVYRPSRKEKNREISEKVRAL
ncbi:ribosome assembly RNA-binding protein YhbY [Enterococcus hirae]|nr:ribosome assembly RNA-binding protein YhbY [Enterococcaceae bacterium]MDM8212852.1 ribosome assembly RNA-binding protein YhbY [Enterococcus hirae]